MTAWFWYCDPLIGVLDYITEVRIYAHARLHQVYLAGSTRNGLPVRILYPSVMMMILSLLKTRCVQDKMCSTSCCKVTSQHVRKRDPKGPNLNTIANSRLKSRTPSTLFFIPDIARIASYSLSPTLVFPLRSTLSPSRPSLICRIPFLLPTPRGSLKSCQPTPQLRTPRKPRRSTLHTAYTDPPLVAPSLQYDVRFSPSQSNPPLSPVILATPATSHTAYFRTSCG